MTELEKATHHLLWVWYQYAHDSIRKPQERTVILPHRNMQAGEQASNFLGKHGYGEDQGYAFVVNDKGYELMERDIED